MQQPARPVQGDGLWDRWERSWTCIETSIVCSDRSQGHPSSRSSVTWRVSDQQQFDGQGRGNARRSIAAASVVNLCRGLGHAASRSAAENRQRRARSCVERMTKAREILRTTSNRSTVLSERLAVRAQGRRGHWSPRFLRQGLCGLPRVRSPVRGEGVETSVLDLWYGMKPKRRDLSNAEDERPMTLTLSRVGPIVRDNRRDVVFTLSGGVTHRSRRRRLASGGQRIERLAADPNDASQIGSPLSER